MNVWDIVLLALVAAAAILALRRIRRGGSRCGGDCAACGMTCPHADRKER